MNVANYYAEQDYGSGALARFATSLQKVKRTAPPKPQPVKRTKPACHTPLQKRLWSILLNSEFDLPTGEIFAKLPKSIRTRHTGSLMRSLLCYWSRSGYLKRLGEERRYTYKVKEQG